MEFHLFAVGKPKFNFVALGVEEYLKRFPKGFEVHLHFLKASTAEEEAELFLQKTNKMRRILLDETGKMETSRGFALQLQKWHEQQPLPFALMIGGADGLAPSLKKGSYSKMSLSSLTFPHEMALLVLCEQLYRAHTIIARHPYHRD